MKYRPGTAKNNDAERIVGLRNLPANAIPFDQPVELGFVCPVCRNDTHRGATDVDERLHWSEYNGFLWCEVCNKDYPSCLCIPLDKKLPSYVTKKSPVDYAVQLYLTAIRSVIEREK